MKKRFKFLIYFGIGLGVGAVILGGVYVYLAYMPTGYKQFEARNEEALARIKALARPSSGHNNPLLQNDVSTTASTPIGPTPDKNILQQFEELELLHHSRYVDV
jgi:hypothetical protein